MDRLDNQPADIQPGVVPECPTYITPMRSLISFLMLGLSMAATAQFNVEPYLQDAEPTSIRVMWESSSEGEAILQWGVDENLGNVLPSQGTPSNGGAMHDVLIEGLTSGTPYYYQVTSGNVSTSALRFRTPTLHTAEASFSFVAMSDMQKSNANPGIFDEVIHHCAKGS